MTSLTHSLWNFAIAIYGQKPIEQVCLQLQDNADIKINMLLWVQWLEMQKISLTPAQIEEAELLITDWHVEVVQPLRRLRRGLNRHRLIEEKSLAEAYGKIKATELAAEKVELEWLEKLAASWPPVAFTVKPGSHLTCYLRHMKIPETQIANVCETFLSAAQDVNAKAYQL